MTNRAIGGQPIGSDKADGRSSLDRSNWPLRSRLFTSLLSLGVSGEGGGGGRRILRGWSRERCINHDWRGGAAKRVSSVYIRREFVARKRERERKGEAGNNPLARVVRACIESTYACTRPLVGAKPLSRNDHVSLHHQPFPLDLPLWCKFAGEIRAREIPTTRPRVSSPVKLTNEIAGPLACCFHRFNPSIHQY